VSVRVNLLPQATKAGAKATRQRGLAAALGLLLLLVLAGVYWWQSSEIRDAEDRLAQEELVAQGLQNEVNALSEYRDLDLELQAATEAVQLSMDGEVSVAAILQDLAARMPPEAQLDAITITLGEEQVDPASGQTSVGTFSGTAQSLLSHAPGVERFLLSIDSFQSLFDLFVGTSTLEEDRDDDLQVVEFTFDGRVSDAVQTDRYADGVPEELR
jgi:Tfp pilus assembly protein PilN